MENVKKLTETALRIILAVVFAYAGALKLANPPEFYTAILNYKILPENAALIVAYFLPALELVCAAALLCRNYAKSAIIVVALMLAVFIVAIISAMWRNLDISCGCFGSSNSGLMLPLLRNFALIAFCAIIFLLNNKRFIS